MSRNIKKVWITKDAMDINSLSIESRNSLQAHQRVNIKESLFPENPTPEHPLRHVNVIQNLSYDDIYYLYETLKGFLYND